MVTSFYCRGSVISHDPSGRRGQQLLLHHLQRHVELMQIRQSSSAVLAPQEHRAAPEGTTSTCTPLALQDTSPSPAALFRTHQNSVQTGTVCTLMHTWKACYGTVKKKKTATMEQYSHLQTVEYCGFVAVFKVYIFSVWVFCCLEIKTLQFLSNFLI